MLAAQRSCTDHPLLLLNQGFRISRTLFHLDYNTSFMSSFYAFKP